MRRAVVVGAVLGLVTALMAAGAVPAQQARVEIEVLAGGLNNPRGVAIGGDGVYVAEAGTGGPGPCFAGPEGADVCLGDTGSITRVTTAGQERVVTGLPSLAEDGGGAASGPESVSIRDGELFGTIGLGADPAVRDELLTPAGGGGLGTLVRFDPAAGSWDVVADIAAFEAAEDPDQGMPGTEVDSNPRYVISTADHHVVVDAGGNTLLRVEDPAPADVVRSRHLAQVSLEAVFDVRFVPAPPFLPPGDIPMQAVPTAVEQGPDGAYYVSELTGFPFPVGGANVYRVVPGGAPEVFATGFTNVIDLAFGPDGSLFVLEIATNSLLDENPAGALQRLFPDGTREQVGVDGLFFPGGVAVDHTSGDVYLTNCGVCPGGGELWRLAGVAAPPAPAMELSYSTGADRADPKPLDGAEVSGAVFVFITPLFPQDGISRVDFFVDGVFLHTERQAPFDAVAGGTETAFRPWNSLFVSDGRHTFSARIHRANESVEELSASFTVENDKPAGFDISFGRRADRSDPTLLEGAALSGSVFVYVTPSFPEGHQGFRRVDFHLDGVLIHSEYFAPYDALGGSLDRAGTAWDTTRVTEGAHTMEVRAITDQGIMVAQANFTVANDGFVTDQPPMLEAVAPGASVRPLLTVGETLANGYRFEAIPDGIAIEPARDSTVRVFVSHETSGVPFRGAADFDNAQLSELTLHTGSGAVLTGRLAIESAANFIRFCSSFLAGAAEGFSRPLLFLNEESSDMINPTGTIWPPGADAIQAGRVVAYDPATGESRALLGMGRLNHENTVALPGYDRAVVLTTDDTFSAPSSQLYMYTAADAEAVWADTGELWAFVGDDPAVNDYGDLAGGTATSGHFIPVPADIARSDQGALEDWSNANNVFQFIRLEDLAYDRTTPNVFYVADTGEPRAVPDPDTGRLMRAPSGTQGPFPNGKIFRFELDPADPTRVTSLSVLIDGEPLGPLSAGVPGFMHNPDNLETTVHSLFIQEDPGGQNSYAANDPNGTTARIWRYDLDSGFLEVVARVDQSADPAADQGDWESSGIVDASAAFGPGYLLVDVQAHTIAVEEQVIPDPLDPAATITLKREGGQLLLLKVDEETGAPPPAGDTVVAFDPGLGELPESLAFDKDGTVYVGLAPRGELVRFGPDGGLSTVGRVEVPPDVPGLLGLAVDGSGAVYGAVGSFDPATQGVWRFAAGSVERLAGTEAIGFANDLAFDPDGNLYVTDSLAGGVWRVTPGGVVEPWLVDPLLEGNGGFGFPIPIGANGIAYTAAGLYVANTEAGSIVKVPVLADGSAGAPEVVVQSPALVGADGLALDATGMIYLSVIAQSSLVRIEPTTGAVTTVATAADGLDWNSSAAFGVGADDATDVYVTNYAIGPPGGAGPAIVRFDVGARGAPVPMPVVDGPGFEPVELVASEMRGSREVPGPGDPDGTGIALVTIVAPTEACFFINVSDLGAITGAHIHRGGLDVSGPVVFDFDIANRPFVPDPLYPHELKSGSGTGDGCVPVPIAAEVAAAVAADPGGYYVNVHTEDHPAGAIRNQLRRGTTPPPAAAHAFPMLGENETAPGDPDGIAQFTFAPPIPATGEWCYQANLLGIDGVSGAHIHRGAAGEDGPVVVDLLAERFIKHADGVGGLQAGGFIVPFTYAACVPVDEALATEILANLDQFYVNVHNEQFPAGALRGQLSAGELPQFVAALSGDEEVPGPGDPDGSGFAYLVLDVGSGFLCHFVGVAGIGEPAAAHLHLGGRGTAGGVIVDFDVEGNPYGPVPLPLFDVFARGCQTVGQDVVDALFAGDAYVNVHTEGFPAGAVRGKAEVANLNAFG